MPCGYGGSSDVRWNVNGSFIMGGFIEESQSASFSPKMFKMFLVTVPDSRLCRCGESGSSSLDHFDGVDMLFSV